MSKKIVKGNMEERRRSPRVELDIKVNYAINAIASLINLSETGMCIQNENGFEVDVVIAVEISLPGNPAIGVFGKVMWSRPNAYGVYDSGIQFFYVEDKDRKALRSFSALKIEE
jgi:hypothetical protein